MLSKATIDSKIRTQIFDMLGVPTNEKFEKINERQYGCLIKDANGVERYARLAVIVAEEREDMSAMELMQAEINNYNAKQEAKATRKADREAKAKRDAEKRAKIAAEKAAKAAQEAQEK